MSTMREIVYCLVHAYPMMFSNIKVNEDQILPDKLDVQAHKLKERMRDQLRMSLTSKKRVAENENVDEQSVKSKRGKTKIIYGKGSLQKKKKLR